MYGEFFGMRLLGSIGQAFHGSFATAARRGRRGKRNDGKDRALRGKGWRVMRSRLVHEWRGVVDGWYFVPFQTRRKPRRQDFGVRLKSCRLNLRLPNQPSTLHNPSVVFFPASYSFSDSHFPCRWPSSTSTVFRHGEARRGKAPWLPPL